MSKVNKLIFVCNEKFRKSNSFLNTLTLFKKMLYKQIDGVAMWFSLGPLLDNAFLAVHKQN